MSSLENVSRSQAAIHAAATFRSMYHRKGPLLYATTYIVGNRKPAWVAQNGGRKVQDSVGGKTFYDHTGLTLGLDGYDES